ncbi:MAG: Lrp/AsnC ligand binding domain-containing protein [Bacteroidales bacterium]|nr:Lrp/AsnC ligand binding domain-containing protein [Bacteroidales bacterium]
MADKFQIDSLDRKIITLLLSNARIPFLEIARECKISGAAVHQRVQRLNRLGILTGSGYFIDPIRMGFHTCAYVGVFLDNAGMFKHVVSGLKKIPEITEIHYTTGQYSLFIKVYAKNNDHLRIVLADGLQAIPGISRTETFISLEEIINRQVPIEPSK